MTTKYIINYFPGSLGDSLIAYIFPNISYNIDNEIKKYNLDNILYLKNPNLLIHELKEKIEKFEDTIISAHFINPYMNYNQLFGKNMKVIYIDPNKLERNIAERCVTVTHKMKCSEIYPNFSEKNKIIRLEADMIKWKNSIPNDANIISLCDLLKYKQNYFESWKRKNNFFELITPTEDFFIHAKLALKLEI